MEAHGGYLCRLEEFHPDLLVGAARQALAMDGLGEAPDASLCLTPLADRRVVRLAFDGPFTYGKKGAHWYEEHHALARILSRESGGTIHAYLLDPDEMEQVTSYGAGRRVGGECLKYADFDPGDEDVLDEEHFERIKQRWPLGRLAQIFGLSRDELIQMPRARSVLWSLDGAPGEVIDLPVSPGANGASLRDGYRGRRRSA